MTGSMWAVTSLTSQTSFDFCWTIKDFDEVMKVCEGGLDSPVFTLPNIPGRKFCIAIKTFDSADAHSIKFSDDNESTKINKLFGLRLRIIEDGGNKDVVKIAGVIEIIMNEDRKVCGAFGSVEKDEYEQNSQEGDWIFKCSPEVEMWYYDQWGSNGPYDFLYYTEESTSSLQMKATIFIPKRFKSVSGEGDQPCT